MFRSQGSTIGLAIFLFAANVTLSYAEAPFLLNRAQSFQIELTQNSSVGEASLREHAIVWHPRKQKYYLIADVIPLSSPHHPNTYETELHLWSSTSLEKWTYHGIAVKKGTSSNSYDAHGVASPAGSAFLNGKLYVPFSARKTTKFTQRGIGLAVSPTDPEQVPWTKTEQPISDLVGEDDDPAVLLSSNRKTLLLYHRTADPKGYQIVLSTSNTPLAVKSWTKAVQVAAPPSSVRAQELTGVFLTDNHIHLLIIEHMVAGGTQIAFLKSKKSEGPFKPVLPQQRYLPPNVQAQGLAYSGHISPITRDNKLTAFSWTVHQSGKRYGIRGHKVQLP